MIFPEYRYGENFRCPVCKEKENRYDHFIGKGKKCLMTHLLPLLEENAELLKGRDFVNIFDSTNLKIITKYFINGDIINLYKYIKVLFEIEVFFIKELDKRKIYISEIYDRNYKESNKYKKMKNMIASPEN